MMAQGTLIYSQHLQPQRQDTSGIVQLSESAHRQGAASICLASKEKAPISEPSFPLSWPFLKNFLNFHKERTKVRTKSNTKQRPNAF